MYKVGDIGSFCNSSTYTSLLRIDSILDVRSELTTVFVIYLEGSNKGGKAKFYIYHDPRHYWHFKVKQSKSHNHPLTKIFK
jgi:hypothetical protein